MSLSVIKTKWYKDHATEGWSMTDNGETKIFLFPVDLLKREYKLRDKLFWEDFKPLVASSPGMIKYLLGLTLGAKDEQTVISLNFDDGYWAHPWEAILQMVHEEITVSSLQTRLNNVSVVRTSEESLQYTPVQFSEPLRVLVMTGYDGRDEKQDIGIEETSRAIIDSWKALPASAKKCIAEPVIMEGRSTTLDDIIRKNKPHLLWYNGHGRGKDEPGIWLADKVWISPAQLSGSIKNSGHQVLFCIFWACDTAEAEITNFAIDNFPVFYKNLLANRILSFVGMQSPIRVGNARMLALETFSHLARNCSFEVAISKARYHVFRDLYKKRDSPNTAALDWASPVIWSTSEPRESYEWMIEDQSNAMKQWSIVEIVRILNSELGVENIIGHELLSHAVISFSQREKNLWINGDIEDKQSLLALGISVLHEMSVNPDQVLVISFRTIEIRKPSAGNSFSIDALLKEWSTFIINSAIPGNLDSEMLWILKDIREYPLSGFKRLIEQQRIRIVILELKRAPREYPEDDWFWQLVDQQKGKVIVVSSGEQLKLDPQYWQIDNLQILKEPLVEIQQAIESQPLLCNVLAVLDTPVDSYYLNQLKIIPSDVEDWPHIDMLCMKMASGRLIYSSAKKYILDKITPVEKKEAHQLCYKLTQSYGSEDEPSWERLFYHSHYADLQEQFAFADELILSYGHQNRYIPAIQIQKQMGHSASQSLTEDARLTLVWAFIAGGRIVEAKFALDRITPKNIINRAYKFTLLSEIQKAAGEINECLRSLDDGINLLEDSLSAGAGAQEKQVIQKLLNLRSDKARVLHYLFYDHKSAIELYTQLLVEYEKDLAENKLQVAIVKRNLSECLRTMYTQTRDEQLIASSKRHLEDAERIVEKSGDQWLLSEIMYEKAKMFDFMAMHTNAAQTKKEEYRDQFRDTLSKCIQASKAGHLMLYAIARNKFFWEFEFPAIETGQGFVSRFENSSIKKIQDDLTYFSSHGWAKRTFIVSKIRSAKVFMEMGPRGNENIKAALAELYQARQMILTKPVLQGGKSDRENIAKIWAGIAVITGDDGEWDDFKKQFTWAAGWISEMPGQRNPKTIWENK